MNRRNSVPPEPIVKLLKKYLAEQENNHAEGRFAIKQEKGMVVFPGPIQILAERAGVHADTIRRMLRLNQTHMNFDVADKLLCAMGMVDEWHGNLADIYWNVDLSEFPPVDLASLSSLCKNGHVRSRKNTVYCSNGKGGLRVVCQECNVIGVQRQRISKAVLDAEHSKIRATLASYAT